MADENEDVGMSKPRMRILSHEIRNRKVYCGDLLTRLEEWQDAEGTMDDETCASLTEWILTERKRLASLGDGGAP